MDLSWIFVRVCNSLTYDRGLVRTVRKMSELPEIMFITWKELRINDRFLNTWMVHFLYVLALIHKMQDTRYMYNETD